MTKYEKAYLTPNPYSRPQTKMGIIKGIVIHWVGNPGSQARANRNYFESLKAGKCNAKGEKIYASSNVESVEREMLQAGTLKDEVESQVEDQIIATMITQQLHYLTQGEAEVLQACLIEGLKSRRKRGLKKLKDRAKLAGII